MQNKIISIYIFVFIIVFNFDVKAWIYPEHRDITYLAIKNLSKFNRDKLNNLWQQARFSNENRLTNDVIIDDSEIVNGKIDFASWPAISGDHSISARDLLNIVLTKKWILDVGNIALELKRNLAKAKKREEKNNALRESDILLQRTDPEYATRAGHNDVHFLMPLINENIEIDEYIKDCIKNATPLNAVGIYIWYHNSALFKASNLKPELSDSEKSKIILAALADEAFALHFLQDMFASGHAIGTWGNASQKKSTHDYYNEFGIKTRTWSGENIVLTGDAWMRNEDAERTANAVKISLEQLINTFEGNIVLNTNEAIETFLPDDFSIKLNDLFPARNFSDEIFKQAMLVFLEIPIPGLKHGIGELPRFRSELGVFTGFAASMNNSLISNGFGREQNYAGIISGMELIYKIGVGLDGILNESSDGLVFLGASIRRDGSATSGLIDAQETKTYGNLLASVPARSAFGFKFRAPFYLLPGDILLAAPILIFASPETLSKMAAIAVNGGLIPWQSGISTSIGRFQFILGREISFNFYGRLKENDVLLHPIVENNNLFLAFCSYRSTRIEFPILEYRPFRSFSVDQSSKIFVQIYGGVDIPYKIDVIEPKGISTPTFQNIWILGIRTAFDWRYYF